VDSSHDGCGRCGSQRRLMSPRTARYRTGASWSTLDLCPMVYIVEADMY
jgi:hypothetical protein